MSDFEKKKTSDLWLFFNEKIMRNSWNKWNVWIFPIMAAFFFSFFARSKRAMMSWSVFECHLQWGIFEAECFISFNLSLANFLSIMTTNPPNFSSIVLPIFMINEFPCTSYPPMIGSTRFYPVLASCDHSLNLKTIAQCFITLWKYYSRCETPRKNVNICWNNNCRW